MAETIGCCQPIVKIDSFACPHPPTYDHGTRQGSSFADELLMARTLEHHIVCFVADDAIERFRGAPWLFGF